MKHSRSPRVKILRLPVRIVCRRRDETYGNQRRGQKRNGNGGRTSRPKRPAGGVKLVRENQLPCLSFLSYHRVRAYGRVDVDETEICERGNHPVNLGLERGLNAGGLTANKLRYLSRCVDSSQARGGECGVSSLASPSKQGG